MNGFITTDGNFGNQAGRTYSANGKNRTTAAARRNAASAYSPANRQAAGINNNAYALPERFGRLASIVSQEDVGYWMQDDETFNNGAGVTESTVPQGNAKDFNAAQQAYSKHAQINGNENGLQDAINNTGTTGKQEDAMTDEELALLEEEEKEKKSSKTYGFSDEDIDYMNRLLEDMKKARERYKASNEKRKTAKKTLNYQFKKVSATISKAKNVTQAGNAVYKAKNALVGLRRKSASGKYDSQEITMAITHANKMVRIAKTKLAHMKEEEAADQYGSKDKISVDFRERRKRERRKDEDLELLKADMEYLKAQIKYIKSGGKSSSSGAMNVSLNTAINASYSIMRKEAVKESIEEFIENNDLGTTMAEIAGSVDAAVSAAQMAGSSTVAASAITGAASAPVPSGGGFTTMI